MRVLVIEDDLLLGDALQQGLRGNGFAVEWLRDGEAGAAALAVDPFDAVVLDLGLPRLDGRRLLEQCRARGDRTPLLVLTARDALDDRVRGLDAGADDYVVKPVAIAELAARLRALVRRASGIARGHLEVGALTLDPASRAVTWHGLAVDLAPREFDVLLALMLKAGRVVTRDQLESALYEWDRSVESDPIEVHVHRLRRKLGTRGDPHGAGRRLHDAGGRRSRPRVSSYSLRRRLLTLLLASIVAAWAVTMLLTYQHAHHELDELLDAHLARSARLLLAQEGDDLEEIRLGESGDTGPLFGQEVVVQVWRDGGSLALRSAGAPGRAPLPGRERVQRCRGGGSSLARLQRLGRRASLRLVQVAEDHALRDRLLAHYTLSGLPAILLGVPLLGVLVWLVVGAAVQTLALLGLEVSRRGPGDLQPLPDSGAPAEVRPLVERLNALFARIAESMQSERRFTSHAAHELRTPIAAIRAQAEVARDVPDPAVRSAALAHVIEGCDRAARLVDQMLLLARIDERFGAGPPAGVGKPRPGRGTRDRGSRAQRPRARRVSRTRHRGGRHGRRRHDAARGAAAQPDRQRRAPRRSAWTGDGSLPRRGGGRSRARGRGPWTGRGPQRAQAAGPPLFPRLQHQQTGQRPRPVDRAAHRGSFWWHCSLSARPG